MDNQYNVRFQELVNILRFHLFTEEFKLNILPVFFRYIRINLHVKKINLNIINDVNKNYIKSQPLLDSPQLQYELWQAFQHRKLHYYGCRDPIKAKEYKCLNECFLQLLMYADSSGAIKFQSNLPIIAELRKERRHILANLRSIILFTCSYIFKIYHNLSYSTTGAHDTFILAFLLLATEQEYHWLIKCKKISPASSLGGKLSFKNQITNKPDMEYFLRIITYLHTENLIAKESELSTLNPVQIILGIGTSALKTYKKIMKHNTNIGPDFVHVAIKRRNIGGKRVNKKNMEFFADIHECIKFEIEKQVMEKDYLWDSYTVCKSRGDMMEINELLKDFHGVIHDYKIYYKNTKGTTEFINIVGIFEDYTDKIWNKSITQVKEVLNKYRDKIRKAHDFYPMFRVEYYKQSQTFFNINRFICEYLETLSRSKKQGTHNEQSEYIKQLLNLFNL